VTSLGPGTYTLVAFAHSSATGTFNQSGGTQIVLSGGLADPTTILSSGTEIVSAGGVK
jgi:autotransporter passenger strand-loop-strand repeat protein